MKKDQIWKYQIITISVLPMMMMLIQMKNWIQTTSKYLFIIIYNNIIIINNI